MSPELWRSLCACCRFTLAWGDICTDVFHGSNILMARILFAWECGGGIGHLTRYSELIDQLIADRHEILFAARSLSSASKVFGGRAVTLMQAPF
jgi:hypothetical protein